MPDTIRSQTHYDTIPTTIRYEIPHDTKDNKTVPDAILYQLQFNTRNNTIPNAMRFKKMSKRARVLNLQIIVYLY